MAPHLWIIVVTVALVSGPLAAQAEERKKDLQTASQDFLSAFTRPPGPRTSSSSFDADLFNRDQFRGGYYPNTGGGCYGSFYPRYAQFLANLFGTRGLSGDFELYRQRPSIGGRY